MAERVLLRLAADPPTDVRGGIGNIVRSAHKWGGDGKEPNFRKIRARLVAEHPEVIAKAFGGDPNKAAGWIKARWYQLRGRPVPGTRGKAIHAALVDADVLELAFFPISARKKLAAKGHAMPDGSFPIRHTGDLKNAIKAHGRAKNKEAVKAHIKKRAAALNAEHLLPDEWKKRKQTKSDATLSLAFEEARHPRDRIGRFRDLLNHIEGALDELNSPTGHYGRAGQAIVRARSIAPDHPGIADAAAAHRAQDPAAAERHLTHAMRAAHRGIDAASADLANMSLKKAPPPGYTYDPELSDAVMAGFTDAHGDQVYIRRRDLAPEYTRQIADHYARQRRSRNRRIGTNPMGGDYGTGM